MSEKPNHQLDLAAIRARLDNAKGPQYWQSLEALAETDEFKDFLYREFPRQASEWADDEPGRRKFLKPLYTELAKTEGGKQRARAIYAQARPRYHAVSSEAIDKILQWEPAGSG